MSFTKMPLGEVLLEENGTKVHLLYDIEVQVSAFYVITTAFRYNSTIMSIINYEQNFTYLTECKSYSKNFIKSIL